MKQVITIAGLIFLTAFCNVSRANIYVIIYATKDGKTGHAGIAIDNYQIETREGNTDTVKQGTLTYFDMWPQKDGFGFLSFSRDREAKFYKLPNSLWPSPITLTSLYDQGIPHKEFYPCDAIIMIRATYLEDFSVLKYLDSLIETKPLFNARFFNCCDFVCMALTDVLGMKLRAREFIPFTFSSTPNKLCKKLMQCSRAVTIKSPAHKIRGSFVREKILKRAGTSFFSTDG